MRNQVYIKLLILILFIGCTREELPLILEKYYPATSDSGKLTSVYAALRNAGTANHGSYFSVQNVSSDEMAIPQKGGDWYDGGIWLEIHRHTWSPSNNPIATTWAQQYSSIAIINDVIRNSDLSPNELAQAKVVRAYIHWRLFDLFGNIVIADGSGVYAQYTSEEVFHWIVAEIDQALQDLGNEDNKYRVNRFAALGIKAKVLLNAPNSVHSPEVRNITEEILNSGLYTLSDDSFVINNLGKHPNQTEVEDYLSGYAAVFAPYNENNPEIIFSVEYDQEYAGGMNFNMMTLHYASQYTYNFEVQPWNAYVALEEFVNSYDDNDKRKKVNFITGVQKDSNGNDLIDFASNPDDPRLNYTVSINELEPNASRTAGARLGKFSFQQYGKSDMNNDFPIVRLGDIILMAAEAHARMGNEFMARTYLNLIRERAGLTPLSNISGGELLLAIFEERGREMFMESSRRTDLIRFGKWDDPWWEKPGNMGEYRKLFPIPIDQLYANPNLNQNPGY